jgi:hypothetical protein
MKIWRPALREEEEEEEVRLVLPHLSLSIVSQLVF